MIDANLGPRFDLRFVGGGGQLHLAQPLAFRWGVLDSLQLDLGRLDFPLDMKGGVQALKDRRTRVLSARIWIDLDALVGDLDLGTSTLRALADRDDGGQGWLLRDPFGSIAFDSHVGFLQTDLLLLIDRARGGEGPTSALGRAVGAAVGAGLSYDRELGVLKWPRAVSDLLAEALVPHGFRMPDDRLAFHRAEPPLDREGTRSQRFGPHWIQLRSDQTRPTEDLIVPGGKARWERARLLGEVIAEAMAGRMDQARNAFRKVCERSAAGAPGLDSLACSLGVFEGQTPMVDPVTAQWALAGGLKTGDRSTIARAASALDELESCNEVAVDALCRAAEALLEAGPKGPHTAEGLRLLSAASARQPKDARLALRLVESLAEREQTSLLRNAIKRAQRALQPGEERDLLTRDAAMICELAGAIDEAGRLWAEARQGLPFDPMVSEGSGRALRRQGALEAALGAFDDAADAYHRQGEGRAGRRALGEAGLTAESMGELAAAEARFDREVREGGGALPWANLSRVRHALGARRGAMLAEDGLLGSLDGDDGDLSPRVTQALINAVDQACDNKDLPRGKAFAQILDRLLSPPLAWTRVRARLLEAEDDKPAVPGKLTDLSARELVEKLSASDMTEEHAEEHLAQMLLPTSENLKPEEGQLLSEVVEISPGLWRLIAPHLLPHAAALTTRCLSRLEVHLKEAAEIARVAELLSIRHQEAGEKSLAAQALARAGAALRDGAMLRAALRGARGAGDNQALLEVLDAALRVFVSGPAHEKLSEERHRLAKLP